MTQSIKAAFLAAIRQRTPGSYQAVREAARKHHDRCQPFRGEFELPNGWPIRYHVTAATVTFSSPEILKSGTDIVDAVHQIATLLIRCALAQSELTPAIWAAWHEANSEPAEGWSAVETARCVLQRIVPTIPRYVREAMAHLLADSEEEPCPSY